MDPHELGIIALITKRLNELQAAFRTLSKQAGPQGKDGISIKGEAGKDGAAGTNGIDGKNGINGKDGQSIVGAAGKDGKQGSIGPMPKHRWTGTSLQFEKPDGDWGKKVDLKGAPGKEGSVTKVFGIGGGEFDFDALPAASDELPVEFLVKQDGVWNRATYAQMQTWLGGSGEAPDTNRVLVGTDRVMVGDKIVRVTE